MVTKVTGVGAPLQSQDGKPFITKLWTISSKNPVPSTMGEYNKWAELNTRKAEIEQRAESRKFGLTEEEKEEITQIREEIIYTCDIREDVSDLKNKKFFKNAKTFNYLGNLFFNIRSKDKYDVESDYNIVDKDFCNYTNKVWIFTNIPVDKYTIHSVDRNNRVGLVSFKDDISHLPFNVLDLEPGEEGIFIVRDTCLARPELDKIGYRGRTFLNTEHSIAVNAIDRMKRDQELIGLPPEEATERVAPATIPPKEVDRKDPVFENISPTNKSLEHFVNKRALKALPPISSYNNLFTPGVPAFEIQQAKKDKSGIYIERWENILRANYDNKNMELFTNATDGSDIKAHFDKFLRDYVGNVSKDVFRYPKTEGEKLLVSNTSRVRNLESEVLSLFDSIDYNMLNPDQTMSYMEVLEQTPNVDLFGNTSKTEVRTSLNRVANNYKDKLSFHNAIALEDLIFIPLKDILENHGEYYEHTSDTVFVINEMVNSKNVVHPASVNKLEPKKFLPAIKDTTEVSIALYSNAEAKMHKVYYMNVLGKVKAVPVIGGNGLDGYILVETRDARSSKVSSETFDYTPEVLQELGLYHTEKEALTYGYNEHSYNSNALKLKFEELELKSKQLEADNEKLKLEIIKKERELALRDQDIKLKEMDLEIKVVENKGKEFKFETEVKKGKLALEQSYLDLKANTLKHQRELEAQDVKHRNALVSQYMDHEYNMANHQLGLQRDVVKHRLDVNKMELGLAIDREEADMRMELAKVKQPAQMLGAVTDLIYAGRSIADLFKK